MQMARRIGIATVAGVATGTAAKTLMQLVAAANHALGLREIGVSFHGINNTHEPITVELLRQTDAGTASALTLVKGDDGQADTLDTTAQQTFTAEPTAGDVLGVWAVHPQTGIVIPFAEGEITVKAGGRLAIRVTAANDVEADGYMRFEE
jgi:hypothetical protein